MTTGTVCYTACTVYDTGPQYDTLLMNKPLIGKFEENRVFFGKLLGCPDNVNLLTPHTVECSVCGVTIRLNLDRNMSKRG